MSCQFVQSFVSIAPGKRGYRRSGNRVKNHMYGKATNQELAQTARKIAGLHRAFSGYRSSFEIQKNCCGLPPTLEFGHGSKRWLACFCPGLARVVVCALVSLFLETAQGTNK